MSDEKKNSKVFYGWVIAICCTLSVCASSLLSTGMSTNLNAMRQVLGLTNTQTSLILTVRSVSAFAASLFSARYFKKLGVKVGMLIAMGFGVLAFLIFTAAGANMPLNYLAAVVAGICYSYGMMLPASMLMKNWFNKGRGLALAVSSCGTGLVSIIFAPLVQSVVNSRGIKAAFLLQAGVIAAVALLLLLFAVDKPEQKGLEPFGGKDWQPEAGKKKTEPREATSLSKFWYFGLIAATALVGMSASPCSANFTNNLVTAGFNNMDVAYAIRVYGFVIIGSKILFGRCVDRLGTFRTTVIFQVICMLGMTCLALVNFYVKVPFMYAALIILAVGCVFQTLGYPNWVADLDSAHYVTTIARCQMGYQLGTVVGSLIPGYLADAMIEIQGKASYAPAYFLFALCTVGSMIIVIGAYSSQKKVRV